MHEIPLVKEEQAKAETERERLLRLMGELQQKYTNERDGLIRDIGIINDLLKRYVRNVCITSRCRLKKSSNGYLAKNY